MAKKCSLYIYRNLANFIYVTCEGHDIMWVKKPPGRVCRNIYENRTPMTLCTLLFRRIALVHLPVLRWELFVTYSITDITIQISVTGQLPSSWKYFTQQLRCYIPFPYRIIPTKLCAFKLCPSSLRSTSHSYIGRLYQYSHFRHSDSSKTGYKTTRSEGCH